MTFPAPEHPPAGNDNVPATDAPSPVPPETQERDAGMYEAGTPGAIERRLLHVDRVTEETLVQVRATNSQMIALIAMVAIVGAMVWLLAKEVKSFE